MTEPPAEDNTKTKAPLNFDEVAMLPYPNDNAALAKRLLSRGSCIALGDDNGTVITLSSPCLEGHRFCTKKVAEGEPLLSWGLPFGHSCTSNGIQPGDVLLNEKAKVALSGRLTGGHHEESSALQELLNIQDVNFVDLDVSPDHPFQIEDHGFNAVGMNKPQSRNDDQNSTFLGYRRVHKGRGVGTRNHVAVVALTASSSPVVYPLSKRWRHYDSRNNFDGVRIVAHTEGESSEKIQRNITHIHRCIAGFLVHPNLGAVVIVTTGQERHVTRDTLMNFVRKCNDEAKDHEKVYPIECFETPHARWVTIDGDSTCLLEELDDAVHEAVKHATDDVQREPVPLSNICVALQCGGSDAFSGLTGNPLAGDVVAKLISNFGAQAILGESPELIGAEPYILSRIANESVAKQFIDTTERYKEYAGRHGLSAAGNPSGGNLYRGLYNIVLKSLGAARKKPPAVALDCVLEYGEVLRARGEGPRYAFMDSPGNDLESIAGQVASGSTIIIFITGNGALTNFPFVPTIKVVTTSRRYNVLYHEMDIDAGPYGHGGNDREAAVNDAFGLCVRIALGERSKGELAGHSQVSIWRNWSKGNEQDTIHSPPKLVEEIDKLCLCTKKEPYSIRPDPQLQCRAIQRISQEEGTSTTSSPLRPWMTTASLALIPTSLCSSAIATNIVEWLMETNEVASSYHILCPSHTEGCGATGDEKYERMYQRLLLGHALHPSVGRVLFLEHGCEKTHNDYFRNCLIETGALNVDEATALDDMFGFCSLQGGGGIEKAKLAVADCLVGKKNPCKPHQLFGVAWASRPITVSLMVDTATVATCGRQLASSLATVVRYISQAHVHVVVPTNSPLIAKTMEGCINHLHVNPSNTTGDIEDLFTPPHSKDIQSLDNSQEGALDETMSTVFIGETLINTTIAPTLLPGQMINQKAPTGVGGLHVMDVPTGVTWSETVSCLGPSCDVMLLVAREKEIGLLPGSKVAPTLRRAVSMTSDTNIWQQWTTETCSSLDAILRSPLVIGGPVKDLDKITQLRQSLFSLDTFVVPRGGAISM